MKFSGVQCLITTTIFILVLVSFAGATEDKDSTKDVKVNSTEVSTGESGRKIFKKKIPAIVCPIAAAAAITDLSGVSGMFSGIQDFLNQIAASFTNIGFPAMPDITSVLNGTDAIIGLKALQLPAIFVLSVIVGAIAAGITLLIPALKKMKPDNMFGSMLDGIHDMMSQASYNVPAQYGAPEMDSYPPSQQGYPQAQSQGYQSPDAYSLTYSGTGAAGGAGGGGGGVSGGNGQDFGATASLTQDGSVSSFFPTNQGQGQGQNQAAPPPASAYNAPSSTYTDPSASYGAPSVKRYNTQQPYPSLSSNYLRSATSRK